MRLKGIALKAARKFAETPAGARILRLKVFRDYDVNSLLRLPAESRRPLAVHAGPLAQKTRRGWRGADLGIPSPPPGRTTIAELQRAYRAGETTPLEVLSHIEGRVRSEDFGQSVSSPFHSLDFQRARRAAETSTTRHRDGEPLGPLDGIPIPVKDHFLMEGLNVDAGSAHLDHRSETDAHLVEVLRDAGAILFATTHTTEWGMDPCGFSQHGAMPRNVYDSDFSAGGSSTGTGVAVSLGFAPVGVGSDGGGSIRIPSAMNGIFGLKPTFVRIGRTGDLFAGNSVSATGPLGTSTADVVEFLAVAATADDPDDPARRWGPRQRNLADRWRRALGRGVDGCRIGIFRREWEELDSALHQRTLHAVQQLEKDGAELVDIDIPLASHAPAIGMLTIGMETLANLQDEYAHHREQFSDSLRMSLSMFSTIDALDFMAARRTRAALRHRVRDVLDDVDLIALPTTRTTAAHYPADLGDTPFVDVNAIGDMTRFTFLANVTGLPAGTVPVGRHKGLPFGVQFVGGAWDEASVIAAMAHAERQGWARLIPPPGTSVLL